jgi:hypothetical protein
MGLKIRLQQFMMKAAHIKDQGKAGAGLQDLKGLCDKRQAEMSAIMTIGAGKTFKTCP